MQGLSRERSRRASTKWETKGRLALLSNLHQSLPDAFLYQNLALKKKALTFHHIHTQQQKKLLIFFYFVINANSKWISVPLHNRIKIKFFFENFLIFFVHYVRVCVCMCVCSFVLFRSKSLIIIIFFYRKSPGPLSFFFFKKIIEE